MPILINQSGDTTYIFLHTQLYTAAQEVIYAQLQKWLTKIHYLQLNLYLLSTHAATRPIHQCWPNTNRFLPHILNGSNSQNSHYNNDGYLDFP